MYMCLSITQGEIGSLKKELAGLRQGSSSEKGSQSDIALPSQTGKNYVNIHVLEAATAVGHIQVMVLLFRFG